ncbi:hypothetical protein M9434_001986 [Picochlorum sp. BPE23]|nr:hypothetical protein M9434_001986 [Picochlorum sp. BPE23]
MSTPAICRALRCTPAPGSASNPTKGYFSKNAINSSRLYRRRGQPGPTPLQISAAFRGGSRGGRGGGRGGRGGNRNFGRDKKRDCIMNEEIDASEVRVIGEDKEPLGIMSRSEALQMAENQEVDLILVVPGATPPVCRLIEYSKFNYEKTKAEKDAKKKQRENAIETKELKMRPGTDVHDYQVKVRAAQKFIDKGFRVKLTLQFRGREMEFKEIGREMFDRFVEDLGGPGEVSIEQAAKMQGRQMNMILAKKEVVQA